MPFAKASLANWQVQPIGLSRCARPGMILSSALRSHLGAGNRDGETLGNGSPLSQPHTEPCVCAGSWAD
ncbi:hypothetical protein EYF80_026505 [Liparis tanakae]|uniref:Uncharacterized protein n=1 Tax=Liparis tanakae TaxID=230148 RepID=A0A4Z2HEC6_9TELE|nr:hypothetical protein EYF80_026505 [Liparis tanakae]